MADRPPLVACAHCAALHERVDPGARGRALCQRCGTLLYRRGSLRLDQWVAVAWACLFIFILAQAFPLVELSIKGMDVRVTFWQSLWLNWERGYYGVAIITGFVGLLAPLAQILLILWSAHCIVARRPPRVFGWALSLLSRIRPWSMASVLLLAIMVAAVKLADLARMQVEPGLVAFFFLTFFLVGLDKLDAAALWREAEDAGLAPVSGARGDDVFCEMCGYVQPWPAGGHCGRCHHAMRRDGEHDASVWALLLAAAIFYIPANMLPMMRFETILGDSNHTILGGVIELWRLGSWDLALIVFVASVLVPVMKLLALAFLLLRNQPRGVRVQRQRTRLYGIVEFIGQWSMLDVFAVVLMAAMANFPGLSQIIVGPAALNFGAVVVLTMWAAMRYDPRLGWDRLQETET